jgi:DNA-binding NarL/FixJ family response regulator
MDGKAIDTAMLKVLVVDDTPGRASALREALGAMEGVEVVCLLESALEILAQVEQHRPDVVLIDTESAPRSAPAFPPMWSRASRPAASIR